MKFPLFSNLDKSQAIETLIENSSPSQGFFFMMVLAVGMATFGLILESSAIVIGSMLVAPLLYPLLSIGMGLVTSDYKLLGRSSYTVFKSIVLSLIASAVVTLIFDQKAELFNPDALAVTEPSTLYIIVAIIAGIAASYALVRPEMNEALPGVAISVALIPPLASIGIGIATFNWGLITSSFVFFLINIIGIIFSGTVIFAIVNFDTEKEKIKQTLKKENEKIKKEEEAKGEN